LPAVSTFAGLHFIQRNASGYARRFTPLVALAFSGYPADPRSTVVSEFLKTPSTSCSTSLGIRRARYGLCWGEPVWNNAGSGTEVGFPMHWVEAVRLSKFPADKWSGSESWWI